MLRFILGGITGALILTENIFVYNKGQEQGVKWSAKRVDYLLELARKLKDDEESK